MPLLIHHSHSCHFFFSDRLTSAWVHVCLITTSFHWLILLHGTMNGSPTISMYRKNKGANEISLSHIRAVDAIIWYSCDWEHRLEYVEQRTKAMADYNEKITRKKYYRMWNPRNCLTWRWYIPAIFEHFLLSQFSVFLFIYFFPSPSSAWYMNMNMHCDFSLHSFTRQPPTHTHTQR